MKQRTKWIVAVITAASASWAMAGPGYACGGCSNLIPVREQIVERNLCYVQQPVMIKRTTCVLESSPRVVWSEPSNPGHVIGSVVSAPFRLVGNSLAWTGSTISGDPYVRSSEFIEPVGERFTTVKVIRSRPLLQPVGEKITTVTTTKKIHHKKHMLKKVTYFSSPMLMPVGERVTTVKILHSKTLLEPVGEKITTTRYLKMRPVLEPVGERTIITRSYLNSWSSCD